ncbi:MAG: exodeoxyribonuclease V subunit beta [Verrucomicrobiae bacterium]|nr:exodeoxyribonuclease V subunit beta [Verrucomicrobiae bacterium]
MTRPEVFSLETTALQPGSSLIEASAGTGKTYTIAGLFVRLVVEHELSVRQILTVTYTVAATEELRGRVRDMLGRALAAFETGTSDVPFIRELVRRTGARDERKIAALQQALLDFDQAPIHTIHSFCQRTLLDHAFESGELFERELVPDMQPMLLDVLNDLWRKHVLTAGELAIACALKSGLAPESFIPFATAVLRHRHVRVHAPAGIDRLDELVRALAAAFLNLKRVWTDQKRAIRGFFGSGAKWANKPYNDDAAIEAYFAAIEAALEHGEISPDTLAALDMFTQEMLDAHRNKRLNLPAPKHEFFELCTAFGLAQHRFTAGLRRLALDFIRTELRQRADSLSAWTFDDLINRVLDALEGPAGPQLTKLLRAKYKAALIDEFQDTDPVQYAIFRKVFGDGQSFFFLVGDPKQAIYGFRGADVFTYLDAADQVTRRYTLEFNWRAAPGLVRAINTVFSRNPNAFVDERIGFYPVKSAAPDAHAEFVCKGDPGANLVVWLWRRGEKRTRKADIEAQIAEAVAGEIARLVSGAARIGARAIEPADIAVLVPENRQAQLMQRVLSALNIPSVLYTTESLFRSRETAEVQTVLAAIATPTNEAAIKAALATDMLGLTADQINALVADESAWQEVLTRFHGYLELWLARGFIQMFRTLLVRERVRERLLQFADGERRMTNLLHLGEVLHAASTERQLGPGGLLKWIAEQKRRRGLAAEEHQLRLERDEKAVKLVTIHRSKGLEYPIVFCPFSWRPLGRSRSGEQLVWFHEPDTGQLALDLGSNKLEQHAALMRREALAEDVRLLYVALTRAKHRCYFVWGAFDGAAESAPAWVLHPGMCALDPSGTEHAAHSRARASAQQELDEQKLLGDLCALVELAGGTIALADLPEPAATPPQVQQGVAAKLEPRKFSGHIQRDWRVASFSSITAGRDADQPDYDPAWAPEPVEPEPATGMFAFPRGARAGECLHRIFEQLDFTHWADQATKNLIAEQLTAHGIRAEQFCDAVFQMLGRVLTTGLVPPGNGTTAPIQLEKVGPARRLTELEFCFPLGRLAPEPLRKLLAQHGVSASDEPEQLSFNPVTGILKGFIDLVFEWQERFYIVDWKSNWLGNSIADYAPAALQAEMSRRSYFLQYLLYTVALDKYLRLRVRGYDYEHHFGGVFYIFVRGVDPAQPELGVYRDKPAAQLIRELAKLLGGPS